MPFTGSSSKNQKGCIAISVEQVNLLAIQSKNISLTIANVCRTMILQTFYEKKILKKCNVLSLEEDYFRLWFRHHQFDGKATSRSDWWTGIRVEEAVFRCLSDSNGRKYASGICEECFSSSVQPARERRSFWRVPTGFYSISTKMLNFCSSLHRTERHQFVGTGPNGKKTVTALCINENEAELLFEDDVQGEIKGLKFYTMNDGRGTMKQWGSDCFRNMWFDGLTITVVGWMWSIDMLLIEGVYIRNGMVKWQSSDSEVRSMMNRYIANSFDGEKIGRHNLHFGLYDENLYWCCYY